MEHHSQTDDTPRSRGILDGQLRESYGRVVYSHKTHEKCADILLTRQSHIRIAQIILSAITTAGFVGAVFGAGQIGAIIGLVVSTILLALNAYTKDYDIGELAQKHKHAANDLWQIRENYLSLLVDVAMREKPIEQLQEHRDKLTEELHVVYAGAPSTNSPAYKKAQDALQRAQDMTFTDAEIDAFLPRELKRGSLAQGILDRELEKILPKHSG
ncbi:MAG: SLATT domain-containing protein [Acidobacteriota bacterium]|nr:SLATT domain-containing protein [Acidobacteriota bacterium]